MVLALTALAAMAAPASAVAALPPCAAAQLSLATDGEGGAFDGMSHSGALLVIRNLGPNACVMPALPKVQFLDGAGKAMPIIRQVSRGMHPGPAVRPIGIAAGAEATTAMRWVSGDVYDKGRCLTPKSISIDVKGQSLATPFGSRICGPSNEPTTFQQPWLKTDPTLAKPSRP